MTMIKKKNITRRKFVKSTCTVFCCACLPLKVLADSVMPSKHNKEEKNNAGMTGDDKAPLLAVCGTYCGACPMYLNNQPLDKKEVKEMFERYAGRPMDMSRVQ